MACLSVLAAASPAWAAPPKPLEALDVERYMGRWYQLALYPNRFQSQCLSDTTATYRLLPNNTVEVLNRCATKTGEDSVLGAARPRGAVISQGQLKPASLEVAFAPSWLRWLPIVWGNYDVMTLQNDNTLAIVSEPNQEYLWVLSREPVASPAQWQAIEKFLVDNGFDLSRVRRESHRAAP